MRLFSTTRKRLLTPAYTLMIHARRLVSYAAIMPRWLTTPDPVTTWLFNQRCLLCNTFARELEGDMVMCGACYQEFFPDITRCKVCASPLPPALAASECGACLSGTRSMAPLSRVFTFADYHPPLSALVHKAKYQGSIDILADLGHVFSCRVERAIQRGQLERPDGVVPVPLHTRRLCQRGYNQADMLAKRVSRQCQLSLHRTLIKRTRATRSQTDMQLSDRSNNVRGAFQVMQEKIPIAHVALIDDVLTTGSTAREIARCLRASGVQRVDLWVLARANS